MMNGYKDFGQKKQENIQKQAQLPEENWSQLMEAIRHNVKKSHEQYSVFKAMRKVAQNLLMADEKYRTLYADNDMVQRKILGHPGGYEFLRGIGFKQGMDDNELVCQNVNGEYV